VPGGVDKNPHYKETVYNFCGANYLEKQDSTAVITKTTPSQSLRSRRRNIEKLIYFIFLISTLLCHYT
jgi:hypothetical protein